ncbi:LytTR family DNA-binding domain-containing protein [Gangjinia marincola]|uniref:LytTR family DNA-binding domain-containing protein n=1 Tax=Gangjinia marincola TaxID=578463 RepID=A0ABN1MI21_9FLAO
MMKVVIIDDEPKARKLLNTLLTQECPQVNFIVEAEDLLSGIALIKKEIPDIVFLDIEMPGHSGLKILDFLTPEEISFEIVFTTAYNEYAVKAFELSAISYLLKPIRAFQVVEAVEKVKALKTTHQISTKLEELRENLNTPTFKKIGLVHAEGIKFANFNDIIMMEADSMYTNISLFNDTLLVSRPLKHYVELLEKSSLFFRPHRSYLINLNYIKEYIKKDGGYLIMENDKIVSISKDKIAVLFDRLNNI